MHYLRWHSPEWWHEVGLLGAWEKPISFELMKRSASWILKDLWFQINWQKRKLRRLWQDHNWKIIGRVNQRVIASGSSSVVGINLDWLLWAVLELPWILSEDFTALEDRPAHSQIGHTLGRRLSPSLSGTRFHMVAPTGASLPGWGDERGLHTVSIQAGENDFQRYTSPQFSARQIQAESFLNHLQPDKFGKL